MRRLEFSCQNYDVADEDDKDNINREKRVVARYDMKYGCHLVKTVHMRG